MSDTILHPEKKLIKLGYGKFCAASYFGDNDCVAYRVKYLEKEKENVMKEIEKVMKLKLTHGHIVEFLEVKEPEDVPNSVFLIMKYFTPLNSFLLKYVNFSNNPQLFNLKVCMLHNIVSGLLFLHNRLGIPHLDLSSSVIFLYYDLTAKVAYFGKIKEFDKNYNSEEFRNKPPESYIKHSVKTKKYDIFSFGCITIEMITHTKPIPDFHFLEEVREGEYKFTSEIEKRDSYLKKINSNLVEIIRNCLHNNPDKRPETSDLCDKIKKFKDTLASQESKERSFIEKIKEKFIEKESKCCCVYCKKYIRDERHKP